MRKITLFLVATVLLFSCKKDETNFSSSSSTTTTTENWVKLSVINAQGIVKPGLKVMMFREPVTMNSPLPAIIKTVVSDNSGLAFFDLNSFITTDIAVKYYFEAFRETNDGLIWESINHPSWNIIKGTMVTSSIIVN